VDGHRHAKLRLRDVSKAILVGTKDGALPVIEAAVDRAISAQLGEAVGSMERALQVTLDYLKARHQFGVPIGSFQVLQHRAVDMAVAVEEARSLAWRAALDLDDGAGAARTISAAKARVGQCGIYVARQAVQLHGGIGTSDEVIISHHLRRQMMLDVSHGDADYHLERFAST
jgi:pimeloyl-CoA dehydrogenase